MDAVEAARSVSVAGCGSANTEARETKSSLARGLSLLALYFALYAITLVDAVASFPVALNILFATANGILIAMLFILGHDCCHGTLVPGQRLNIWLGRFAFIPVVHSVSLWCEAHNKQHHARTNLKGFDPVWAPMSVDEYRSATAGRRLVERIYRSAFGPAVYYLFDIWMAKLVFPFEHPAAWRRHLPETLFTLAGFLLTLAVIVFLGRWLSPHRALWLTLLLGWAIPFLVWNYFAAVTTYMNHTHPEIPWFADETTWSAHAANVAGTVHVKMPFDILPLYSDVMAHTAHHARLSTPVYSLPRAQERLRTRFSGDIKAYTFSFREYRRIYATCKLFDFENMCWTDFSGAPTTARIKTP